ncbi:MAG: TolC family protein [Opitutaceae bacterium]|nr:TolC family protein [Cytophagales bacterium]
MLKEAIAMADSQNIYLKALKYNIDIAEADIITGGLRPNLNFNNQSLQLLNPNYFTPGTGALNNRNRQVWYQLTKQFQLANKRKLKIDLAKENVNSTVADIEEFRRNLSLEVANVWLNMWLLKNNLKLLQSSKKNIDTLININKVRLKNEVITPVELIRTEVLADQYDLDEKKTRQELYFQSLNLAFLLGIQDSVQIRSSDTLDVSNYFMPLDSILQESMRNRTDVVQALAALRVSEANLSLQKAFSMPNIEAGGIYNPQNSIPYGGIFITVPLPFFDRNQGEIQKSKVVKTQAQSNLEVAQANVRKEVTIAYLAFETQKRNLGEAKDILIKSSRVLNTVRYAYLKGNTTIIDYLEARRSLYDTQKSYNSILYNLNQSFINLLFYSGLINSFNKF